MELTSTHEQLQKIFKNPKVTAKELKTGILQCVGSAQNSDTLQFLKIIMNNHHPNTVKATRKRALMLLVEEGCPIIPPEDLKLPQGIQKAITGREKYLQNQTQQAVAPQPDQGADIGGPDQGVSDPTLLEIPAKRARRTPVKQSINTGGNSSGSVNVSPPSAESAALISELAGLFGVETARIEKVRKKGTLYSLIDIAMLVTGKDQNLAGAQIRAIFKHHPEVQNPDLHANILHGQFPGPKEKITPMADVCTLVQIILRLPKADTGKCIEGACLFGKLVGVPPEAVRLAALCRTERVNVERVECAVLRSLTRHGFVFIAQVRVEGKLVDAVVNFSNKVQVLVEVDEKQHKGYGVPNEVARMQLLKTWALQQSGSTWLVRFNPHEFKIGDQVCTASRVSASQTFVNAMKQIRRLTYSGASLQAFNLVFLYYDMDASGNPLILEDPHFPDLLRKDVVRFDLATQAL
jgi:very-short-patch-repair endonuclease